MCTGTAVRSRRQTSRVLVIRILFGGALLKKKKSDQCKLRSSAEQALTLRKTHNDCTSDMAEL